MRTWPRRGCRATAMAESAGPPGVAVWRSASHLAGTWRPRRRRGAPLTGGRRSRDAGVRRRGLCQRDRRGGTAVDRRAAGQRRLQAGGGDLRARLPVPLPRAGARAGTGLVAGRRPGGERRRWGSRAPAERAADRRGHPLAAGRRQPDAALRGRPIAAGDDAGPGGLHQRCPARRVDVGPRHSLRAGAGVWITGRDGRAAPSGDDSCWPRWGSSGRSVTWCRSTSGQVDAVVALIGLALGVDYSMFYLRRKLEERRAGRENPEALATGPARSAP